MKNFSMVLSIASLIISVASTGLAYLTEKAVEDTLIKYPLPSGNGNVPGTHNKFTSYSIENLDFRPGVKDKLDKVKDTIQKKSGTDLFNLLFIREKYVTAFQCQEPRD